MFFLFLKLLKIDFEIYDAIIKFNPRYMISNKYSLLIYILDEENKVKEELNSHLLRRGKSSDISLDVKCYYIYQKHILL